MHLGDTGNKEVTVGMAEKDSPMWGYLKPAVQALCTSLILYLAAEDFDKTEMISIVFIWMAAFGLETINVKPKGI